VLPQGEQQAERIRSLWVSTAVGSSSPSSIRRAAEIPASSVTDPESTVRWACSPRPAIAAR
jgi:hypothetical protein